MARYEGTWVEGCAQPVDFGNGVFGPASTRETLVISKSDAAGGVTIEPTEEFFDSTLACYDTTAVPVATVKATIPYAGRFARQAVLQGEFGPTTFTIVTVTQAGAPVAAVGPAVSSVDLSGVASWRIGFSDGSFVDREKALTQRLTDVGFLRSDGLANGQPVADLRFFGLLTRRYLKTPGPLAGR